MRYVIAGGGAYGAHYVKEPTIDLEPWTVLPDAGHGLQEDQGPMLGKLMAAWLEAN